VSSVVGFIGGTSLEVRITRFQAPIHGIEGKQVETTVAKEVTCTLETIMGNFASHCQDLATAKAPFKTRMAPIPGMPAIEIEVKPCHNGHPENGDGRFLGPVWDDCSILGISVGNRCGLISAYSLLVNHYLGKLFKIEKENIRTEVSGRYDRTRSREIYNQDLLIKMLDILVTRGEKI
jgi:hypothetical protein